MLITGEGTVKLTEIGQFSRGNHSIPEPEINNLMSANDPDRLFDQLNLTIPLSLLHASTGDKVFHLDAEAGKRFG